ncbi:MAG TPA: acyl-CoA desaturase [Myxococcota bacterium]|nr:acyl-CoA desaturase [Myxococcota bacterium]
MSAPADSLRAASLADPRDRPADGVLARKQLLPTLIYWGLHALALLVLVTAPTRGVLLLMAATFFARLFSITAGYHRYFAHRGYRTSRAFQFVLAFVGCSATQKGPLWWAGGHRRHHRYSDQPGDMHSPREGFWYSHQGWILDTKWERTELENIRDFGRYPELVWLNRWHFVPPILLAILCWAIAGFAGVVWGYVFSTVLLWHVTYSINSLAHRWGSQRYETGDDSRNNFWLALLTWGEGWHNNHHWFMSSARNGFFWWEIDLTYYGLRLLALCGLVWELREVPERFLRPVAGTVAPATELESSPS